MTGKTRKRIAFAEWVRHAPDPPACLTCGRVVLIGRCCSDPKFPPWPPCATCGVVFGTTAEDCCANPYFPDEAEKSDDTK